MEDPEKHSSKSKVARFGQWLVTDRRDGSKPDIKAEMAKMSRGFLLDYMAQLRFVAKAAVIGAVVGGVASAFFGYTFLLGAVVGFVAVGLLAFVSWIPGGRR